MCNNIYLFKVLSISHFKKILMEKSKRRAPRVLTINHVREIAEQRNGKLLTEEYINSRQKFEFECYNGHTFKAKFHKVDSGGWCPEC